MKQNIMVVASFYNEFKLVHNNTMIYKALNILYNSL